MKFIGWQNITYQSFTPGTPDPSDFAVPNQQYCQQCDENQCDDTVALFKLAPSPRTAFLAHLLSKTRREMDGTTPLRALLRTLEVEGGDMDEVWANLARDAVVRGGQL